jgi:hypothetical protein
MELYSRMKATPVEIDLADLWQHLGVEPRGATVVFHDDASLASVRRAITPTEPSPCVDKTSGLFDR